MIRKLKDPFKLEVIYDPLSFELLKFNGYNFYTESFLICHKHR